MKLSFKLPVLLVLGLSLFATFATPAMAASDNQKYNTIYNSINNTYTSLKNIAKAHDKWIAAHSKSCGTDQSKKWWVDKYRKDVKAVTAAENKLSTVKNKHAQTYADFAKTFTDLVHWMNKKIEPRLTNCKAMPTKSSSVDNDFQTLQNDLGLTVY